MNFTVLSAGYSHLMNPEVSMNLKDCFGGMISSPSFTYSLVSFSPATHSMQSASKPDFPEKDKLLLLFVLFLYVCCLCSSSCCEAIVFVQGQQLFLMFLIFNVLFMFSKAVLLFHRSDKSQLSEMIQGKLQLHKHS